MEIGNDAVFFSAIVEKRTIYDNYVLIQFRAKGRHRSGTRYQSQAIKAVWISDDEVAKRQFLQAKRLRAGDEIFVEYNLEEWRDPQYLWFGRRWWNLFRCSFD